MSKIKPSSLFKRQIPEFIRNEYPLFVDFLKAYYEYLDQTQQLDLEKVRDIGTTLDEFVERYRREIASKIPLDMAEDPREFLRRAREFYLSRGSEASYKFLFRTLFGKEAQLIYPSRQVLRASDGRWKQDISVFCEIQDGSPINPDTNFQDLFPLSENFVTIKTSTKELTTYVDRVVYYGGDIYEVFIQRDYSNDVEVGSIVSATVNGLTFSGVVQPCPTTIKVFKGGTGFKPGDIFLLKTQKGRGCEVKVTKTGTNGQIRAIQVLSFGLDYDTRFFSYLSAESREGWEYQHPISLHLNADLNVLQTSSGYIDASGGTIEAGYALKQTYLSYDGSYGATNSDNFFVQGDYVGDPVSQFYSDNTSTPLELQEEIAIIDIRLGAIAVYPGYYETQDSFISDEMYIQDGDYYQSFSYVIRVEEQLDKYSEIVKSLLHPAGMKLFAEYNISNELKVAFEEKRFYRLLQAASEFSARDDLTSYSYTDYTLVFEDGPFGQLLELVPVEGTDTYSVNAPWRRTIKPLTETIVPTFSETIKYVEKPLESLLAPSSLTTKYTQKDVNSNEADNYIDALFTYGNYLLEKPFYSSSAALQVDYTKFVRKPLFDTQLTIAIHPTKEFEKEVYAIDNMVYTDAEDLDSKVITKPILNTDSIAYTGLVRHDYELEKLLTTATVTPTDLNNIFKDFFKEVYDVDNFVIADFEYGNYEFNKDLNHSINALAGIPTRNIVFDPTKIIDEYSISDADKVSFFKDVMESFLEVITDDQEDHKFTKSHVDILNPITLKETREISKFATFIANATHALITREIERILPDETVNQLDVIQVAYHYFYDEIATASDLNAFENEFTKRIINSVSPAEDINKDITHVTAHTANTADTGAIRFNPYEQPGEGYFYSPTYQPYIAM